jgi:3-deoxy-7-phosphoheptulonate synthase
MLLIFREDVEEPIKFEVEQQLLASSISFRNMKLKSKSALFLQDLDETQMKKLEQLPLNIFEAAQGQRWLSSKLFKSQSIIEIKGCQFGASQFPVISGPCSVENEEQVMEIASLVKQAGAHGLRGGAFKPRTLPYDFQGLGRQGLKYLRQAADEHQLFVVSEIMDIADLDVFMDEVDLIQIGARNMQNFALLKALGKVKKPILLKRGLSARYEEWLASAEYILAHGNHEVILCERGIRGFETHTRNTLDIAAAPIIKDLSHLPIIIDPSHGLGLRKHVPALSYAAMAAGADGLMIEMHTQPDQSISDAKQTIAPETLVEIMQKLKKMATVFDRLV